MSYTGVFFLALFLGASAAWAGPSADCNQTGDPELAIHGCTQIINRDSESQKNRATAYRKRGIAYKARGDNDRAVNDYDKGNYFRKGDYDYAIADYNKSIELNPKDAATYSKRGFAYETIGAKAKAIADYHKALTIEPFNEEAKAGLKRLGEP